MFNVSEFLLPGKPIIAKELQNWYDAYPWELNNVTFTLVDCQDQPIKLFSPLNIVVEIKKLELDEEYEDYDPDEEER